MSKIVGVHHLALVTGSLERTIRYWRDLVGLEMRTRLGAPGYRQYFFAAGERTLIAFFEWPGAEAVAEKDHGAPFAGRIIFDHVALELSAEQDLFELRDRIDAAGFWVSEPMDQGFVRSIYSFDPNGVPVEFAVGVPGADFREVPLDADRDPSLVALEGRHPRPGVWAEPAAPGERVVYPGAGSEYFHGRRDPRAVAGPAGQQASQPREAGGGLCSGSARKRPGSACGAQRARTRDKKRE